jgi:protein-S-isoprenylcysteine O-methyltransferase Ste14
MKGEAIMKPSVIVVTILLILVSIAHLLRLVFQAKVTLNSTEIPMWLSIAGCIVTAVLAIWLWQDNKK